MNLSNQKALRELVRDHSDTFLNMAFTSQKQERIAKAHGHGADRSDCGDQIDIYLMIKKGVVEKAAFNAAGCLNTYAVANSVAHLVEGRTLGAAWQLSAKTIMDYLQTLSVSHTHCAELAVSALKRALKDYQSNQRDPWRALYKRN